ncbi:hypothetical protein Tco_0783540 [Tanacetum coccineum]
MSHEISLKQPTMSHEFSLVHLISPEHEQANSISIRASIDFDEEFVPELDSTLKEMHFQQGMEENAVYRKVPNREFIIVAVYVDELTYYLGIKVLRKKYFVKIKHERYANKILKEAGMEDCIATLRLMNQDSSYLTYSIGVVSRYMQSLRESHARAIKQILHYLKGAILFGIEYKQGNHMKLVGFRDSSHNVHIDDGHTELMAATAVACQAIWLRELLAEVMGMERQKVIIQVDNKSAIALSNNRVFLGRSKHIHIRYHFIHECMENEQDTKPYIKLRSSRSVHWDQQVVSELVVKL